MKERKKEKFYIYRKTLGFIRKSRWIDIFILIILAIFIHRGWFRPGVLDWGDWWAKPTDVLRDFFALPYVWDLGLLTHHPGHFQLVPGGVGHLALTNYPILLLHGLISKFGFGYETVERIIYFFPYIILSILSIYYFTYVLFKKRIICFFSTIFYAFNASILILLAGGNLLAGICYALTPLIVALFIRSLEKNWFKNALLCGALLTVSTWYDFRFNYLNIIVIIIFLFGYLLSSKNLRNLVNPMYIILIISLMIIVLNFYWILPTILVKLPTLPTHLAHSGMVRALSYGNLSHAAAVYPFWWPPGSTGVQQVKLAFYLIPILAGMAIVFHPKSKNVMLLTILAVGSVFLVKGSKPPFGEIYIWLFKHFPGFNLFRVPGKFGHLVCLAYAPLIGVTIDSLAGMLRRIKFKPKLISSIFLVLMFSYLFYLVYPAIKGKLGGIFISNKIPNEYKIIEKFIKSQNPPFRTFWRPVKGRYSFYNQQYPLLASYNEFPKTFERFFLCDFYNPQAFTNTKHIGKILGLLNVKYAILTPEELPYKYHANLDKKFFLSTFNAQEGLRKIDIGRNIDIFENKYFTPRFFATPYAALVVGGRKAMLQLASLEEMDLSRWAIFFADELRNYNIDLLNHIETVIFYNKNIDDLILSSVSEDYRMDLSKYAIRADDPTPRKWQRVITPPLDIYSSVYGEIAHNHNRAIYAPPGPDVELSSPIPIDIKKSDTFEIWLRGATGPDMGKLNVIMSKNNIFNETFTYYDDFETDKWKRDAYYYEGFLKYIMQPGSFHGGALITSSGKGESLSELVYKINSQSPIRSMWMEWDTIFLNPNRIGRFFVSENSEKWNQVGESLTYDIHPYRVDISKYAYGKKEFFIKYQVENTPDNWGGGPSLLKIGYHYDTVAIQAVITDKDLKNENPTFQWIKGNSIYLEKGKYYLNIINKEGRGMLDQLVIVPKSLMDALRRKVLKRLNQKNIVVIIDEKSLLSNVHIPFKEQYQVTANLNSQNISDRYSIKVNGRDVKKTNLTHKNDLLVLKASQIKLDKGINKIELSSDNNSEFNLDHLILYNTDESISSIHELFKAKEIIPVAWKMINPTKYEIKLKTKKPTFLIFSETFHPLWVLNLKKPAYSISAYSMINSFLINKQGEVRAIIEFTPQRYVYVGFFISCVGLVFVCFCLIYTVLKKN